MALVGSASSLSTWRLMRLLIRLSTSNQIVRPMVVEALTRTDAWKLVEVLTGKQGYMAGWPVVVNEVREVDWDRPDQFSDFTRAQVP